MMPQQHLAHALLPAHHPRVRRDCALEVAENVWDGAGAAVLLCRWDVGDRRWLAARAGPGAVPAVCTTTVDSGPSAHLSLRSACSTRPPPHSLPPK